MTTVEHDFAAQRSDTFTAFKDISSANDDLPDVADVDYAFITDDETADWQAFVIALHEEGYDCSVYEADETDPESAAHVSATLFDLPISAMSIWIGEEVATRVALRFGFRPDGWGFAS
jgi:hypothetical protein